MKADERRRVRVTIVFSFMLEPGSFPEKMTQAQCFKAEMASLKEDPSLFMEAAKDLEIAVDLMPGPPKE